MFQAYRLIGGFKGRICSVCVFIHVYLYIYIYIYTHMCVCVCVCVRHLCIVYTFVCFHYTIVQFFALTGNVFILCSLSSCPGILFSILFQLYICCILLYLAISYRSCCTWSDFMALAVSVIGHRRLGRGFESHQSVKSLSSYFNQ